MPIDAWILAFLIVAVTSVTIGFVLLSDRRRRKREEQLRCPICQGGDRRTIYRERGFDDWCIDHRGSWWGPSFWDRPKWLDD